MSGTGKQDKTKKYPLALPSKTHYTHKMVDYIQQPDGTFLPPSQVVVDGIPDRRDPIDGGPREFTYDEREDANFRAVANTQNVLILPAHRGRGGVLEHLSMGIPLNEFGLPLYYIRSDLLDLHSILLKGHTTQDDVDSASEVLSYQDGYPTLQNGAPFWTQMAHEPISLHQLFKNYLDLNLTEGIRLLQRLSELENIPLDTILETSQEFFWSARAKAYDLFIVAADAKRKEALTRKTESHHYDLAAGLLEKIHNRLTDEELEKLDASELLDAMEQMVKIQRLSLGLTGQNASSVNKDLQAPAQSVEVILRQLTKNNGPQDVSQEDFRARLATLLSDPEGAMHAQETIVRLTSGNAANSQSV